MKATEYLQSASESDFKDTVIDLAHHYKWLVHHDRPARTSRGWATAIQGDAGFPDLVLAKFGRIIFAELKTETGGVTDEQQTWLDALANWHSECWVVVWRPSDMGLIRELLSSIPGDEELKR